MIFFHHSTHLATDGVVVVVAGLTLAASLATHALVQEQLVPSTFTSNAVLVMASAVSLVGAITVMVGSMVALVKVISDLKKISVKQDEAVVTQAATHSLVNSQGEEMRRLANALGVTEGIAQEKAAAAVRDSAAATTVLAVKAAVEQERERSTVPVVPAEVVVVNPDPVAVVDVKPVTLHRRKPPAAKG